MDLAHQTHTTAVALHMVVGVHRLGILVHGHRMTLVLVQVAAALMRSLLAPVLQPGAPPTAGAAHQHGIAPRHLLVLTVIDPTTLLPREATTRHLRLALTVVPRHQVLRLRRHRVPGLTMPLRRVH